jgi:hypothetical protein
MPFDLTAYLAVTNKPPNILGVIATKLARFSSVDPIGVHYNLQDVWEGSLIIASSFTGAFANFAS